MLAEVYIFCSLSLNQISLLFAICLLTLSELQVVYDFCVICFLSENTFYMEII